jgi:RNA polymerase sigma-70 factor, ECF subfamily
VRRLECIILRNVDAASSKPADLVLPLTTEQLSTQAQHATSLAQALPLSAFEDLWRTADADSCGLSLDEFSAALTLIGEKVNHGQPPGSLADAAQKISFFRSLHLNEFALAHGCALGREVAWDLFLTRYRSSLSQTAISITGSATLGDELADNLYAELYGLREAEGERRCPLASYSGRGSLLGWLRTTLVQRSRDHHRRTWREEPLELDDSIAPAPAAAAPAELTRLTAAVAQALRALVAEDRFLLSAYFLDQQTLLQIARTLSVHEATISRRIKRLAEALRKQLLRNMVAGGLSKAAAEEALGADPRDIEINLRALLQTSQSSAFSSQTAAASDTA